MCSTSSRHAPRPRAATPTDTPADPYLLHISLMDKALEDKQLLLRREVLEAGLDPEEFLEFMVSSNPKKGSNIELWSLPELRDVVAAYRLTKDTPSLREESEAQSEQQEVSEFSALNNPNTLDDSLYRDNIKCELREPSRLSQVGLRISVTRFEKIEGGVFERAYVVYTMETEPLKTVVTRRYSDFVWLRETFLLLCPGYPLPPVAKRGSFKRYDDKYLTKKMLILEKFLNAVVLIPQVFSHPLFESFLTIADQKEFQKYRAQFNKIGTVSARKIKNTQGYVTVSTEKTVTAKVGKYQEYLKATQPEVKKIFKNFKGAATCLEGAADYLQCVSSNCKFLRLKDEAIRNDLELPPIANNSPFSVLESLATQYSQQLQLQAKTFRREIYSQMKYENLYKLNLLEAMDQLAVKQQEYSQARAALLKKKEKLFSDGKMDKWNLQTKPNAKPATKEQAFSIMLPKQTKQLLIMRQNYGLYNAQMFEECFRMANSTNLVSSTYLREFLQAQATIAAATSELTQALCVQMEEVEQYHRCLIG